MLVNAVDSGSLWPYHCMPLNAPFSVSMTNEYESLIFLATAAYPAVILKTQFGTVE